MAESETERADTSVAFLFAENGGSRRAVTRDVAGFNLPQANGGWTLKQSFLLAVDHVPPFDIEPEPVIRAIAADGFYCWDEQALPQPKGTGQ